MCVCVVYVCVYVCVVYVCMHACVVYLCGVCVCAATHCHAGHKKSSLDKKARKKLIVASVLCLVFMVAEVVGK